MISHCPSAVSQINSGNYLSKLTPSLRKSIRKLPRSRVSANTFQLFAFEISNTCTTSFMLVQSYSINTKYENRDYYGLFSSSPRGFLNHSFRRSLVDTLSNSMIKMRRNQFIRIRSDPIVGRSTFSTRSGLNLRQNHC